MLDLNSTIDLNAKTFLRWWARELSFLVPDKIKRLLGEQQGFIIVRAENHHFILNYQFAGQTEQLAKLERDKSSITHYKDLLARNEELSKAKVILRLTGQDAIQKELTLPLAAKENLQQVVAYELDRYTPFKADEVYFSVKLLPPSSQDSESLKALLILTTRTAFNALYEDVKAMGIMPMIVDYEGVDNALEHGMPSYNLLPERLRPSVAKLPRIIHTGLISGVLLLLSAVIVLPVWFEYQAVTALSAKVQQVEKEAKKIKELQSEIDAQMEQTQLLLDEKTATPSVLTMLNTLSKLMKNDTWLSYLQYADGQLQIQGESPAASTLIAVLEDSPIFHNAVFVSPVTQDSSSKQEHFQITVEPTKTKKVTTDGQ